MGDGWGAFLGGGDEPLGSEEPEAALYEADGHAQLGRQVDDDGAGAAGSEQAQDGEQLPRFKGGW